MSDHKKKPEEKERKMYWEKYKPNPVNYANNCERKPAHEKHHILPGTSFTESIKDASKNKPLLADGLKFFTKWNINDKDNLIPLPTRRFYQNVFGNVATTEPMPANQNLPCHQPVSWGHAPEYNGYIETALNGVWGQVAIVLNEHGDIDSTNSVAALIEAIRIQYKGILEAPRMCTKSNWDSMWDEKDVTSHLNFMMVPKAKPF